MALKLEGDVLLTPERTVTSHSPIWMKMFCKNNSVTAGILQKAFAEGNFI